MRVQIESSAAGKAGGVAPKRAVMWWVVRPLAAEGKVRVERSENGKRGFGCLWPVIWLVVVASLRPSGTSHVGSPSYCMRANMSLFLRTEK